jgi:hypothetical protein
MEGEQLLFSILSNLLEQLHVLEWNPNPKQKSFAVPYKTLLREVGRTDLAVKKSYDKDAIVKILRDSKEKLEERISKELDGDPYSLIPVLNFFASTQQSTVRGTKREREVAPKSKKFFASTQQSTVRGTKREREVAPKSKNTTKKRTEPLSQKHVVVDRTIVFKQLVCVPGAQKHLRMSPQFFKADEMASWLYDYLTTGIDGRYLSDLDVSNWLKGHGSFITPKFLRLQETLSHRGAGLLLILDFPNFVAELSVSFGVSISDYAKLATFVALRWSDLKNTSPWSSLSNKQLVLADLVDPTLRFSKDEWASIVGPCNSPYVIVTREALACITESQNIHMLTIARRALGIKLDKSQQAFVYAPSAKTPMDVARLFGFGLFCPNQKLVQSDAGIYLAVLPSSASTSLLFHQSHYWTCLFSEKNVKELPGLLKNNELPSDIHASRVFSKTGRVPKGLLCDKEGIYLAANPAIKFCFSWYKQKNGIMDLDNLFHDAFQLLVRSVPVEPRKYVLCDIVKAHGLLGGLQKLTELATIHYTYPDHIFPLFDMRFLPVASQKSAYEIHRLTGRFSSYVSGYYHNGTGFRVLLSDICRTKQHINEDVLTKYPWITGSMRKNFSTKELCFLMVVFGNSRNNPELKLSQILLNTHISLGKTDVDSLQYQAPKVNLRQLYEVAMAKLIGVDTNVIEHSVNNYLQMIMETDGPFLVLDGATQDIQDDYSAAVLTEQQPMFFNGDLAFVDLPRGLSNFSYWLNQQARNREYLMPNVPCQVRIRKTGEIATLVVFKYEKDRWHIWNGNSMGEYVRKDFDVIENTRCLPAPVHVLTNNSSGIALKKSIGSDDTYWVKQSESDVSVVKMTLGKHFTWSQEVYTDPNILHHYVPAEDRAPELVDEVFDQDSAFVYQTLSNTELVLPGKECNDWAMREFFSHKSQDSIWPFISYFHLHVNMELLYHAFYLGKVEFESERSWAVRNKLHVRKACQWFWEKILNSDIEYDRLVWKNKLKDRDNSQVTFDYIIKSLYE